MCRTKWFYEQVIRVKEEVIYTEGESWYEIKINNKKYCSCSLYSGGWIQVVEVAFECSLEPQGSIKCEEHWAECLSARRETYYMGDGLQIVSSYSGHLSGFRMYAFTSSVRVSASCNFKAGSLISEILSYCAQHRLCPVSLKSNWNASVRNEQKSCLYRRRVKIRISNYAVLSVK